MNNPELIGLLTAGGSLALFLLVWVGIITLIGRFSGWNKIAQAMPSGMGSSTMSYDEKIFRFQTLRLGMSQYKGCVSVATSRYGLTLKLWKIFSFGHQQPLFIPWSEITALEPQTFMGFSNGILVKLKNSQLPRILLYGKIFENNSHLPLNLQNSGVANPHQ